MTLGFVNCIRRRRKQLWPTVGFCCDVGHRSGPRNLFWYLSWYQSLLSDKFTVSGTLEVGSILLLVVACNGRKSFTFYRPLKHIWRNWRKTRINSHSVTVTCLRYMKPGLPTNEIIIIITATYSLNIKRVAKLNNGLRTGHYVRLGKRKFIENFRRHSSWNVAT